MFNLTPVVKNLLIINVLVHLLQLGLVSKEPSYVDYFHLNKTDVLGTQSALYGEERIYFFEENGKRYKATGTIQEFEEKIPGAKFYPYQIVVHFFSHSVDGIFHILMNMLVLGMIGPQVERVIGSKRFLSAYLVSGVLGGIFVTLFDPSVQPVVGASGAISGVLLLFGMIYPNAQMILFPIPIPIRAKWLITGLIVISTFFILQEASDPNDESLKSGISHFGHMMGMAAVFLYLQGVRLYYRMKR